MQLVPHIKPRDEQFGFRAEHSTTLQITRLVHEMATAMNKKEYTVAVLLDMEKAFDRVWHEGLVYKLSRSSAPRRIVKIVASYLENRKIKVSIEDAISSEKIVEAGVPQGSCIAPYCYAWYTDDIPVVGHAKLALYADDAAYFATSIKRTNAVKRLQPTLDALPEWLGKWRLSVNVKKTQAIAIGCKIPPPRLQLMGDAVDWLSEVKYLGVTIDRRLNFHRHVDDVVGRAKGSVVKLLPILKSKLPVNTKIMLYKTYIRSRLTYAGPAWYGFIAQTNRNRLQRIENRCYRTIVNAPRYVRNATIFKDLRRHEDVELFIRKMSTNMFARADASDQEHIRGIAPLHARPPDREGKKKMKPYPRELILTEESKEESDTATNSAIPPVGTALVADQRAGLPTSGINPAVLP